MRRGEPVDVALGLECAWPGSQGPRPARMATPRTVYKARLVTFVLWILTGLGYGGAVSERGQ